MSESIISFIKNEDPDIIFMQEVRNVKDPKFDKQFLTLKVFEENFNNYKYSIFSPKFLNTIPVGDIEEGNAIFSKFPIKNTNVLFFDKKYGRYNSHDPRDYESIPSILQYGIVEFNNIDINLFNIHGIWGRDGKDSPKRLKMGGSIVRLVKNKKNAVLAGDFNVLPDTKTIKMIEDHLVNVFKDELKTTFNTRRKGKKVIFQHLL